TTLPIRKHKFPTPKLRLQFEDLKHPGASVFLRSVHSASDIELQIQNVLNLLYLDPSAPRPPTRSITFVLEDMPGVAYTTGTALDDDHKEIHISLGYIALPRHAGDLARAELLGVICHELVHCFQYNACNTAPGGLIEGIADWVRLNAGLAARHWKREAEGQWDRGYQHTGYFLQWLEEKFAEGTVRRINGLLREEWDAEGVFGAVCAGRKVEGLWEEYQREVKRGEGA
ncbi:plant basic secretory protein, partial [Teratosphaeria nubilosa]